MKKSTKKIEKLLQNISNFVIFDIFWELECIDSCKESLINISWVCVRVFIYSTRLNHSLSVIFPTEALLIKNYEFQNKRSK